MPLGQFLVGMLFFLPVLATTAWSSRLILRKQLPYLVGLPGALSWATIATAVFVLAHVLPAALGVLSRGTVLAVSLAMLGASALLPERPPSTVEPRLRPPRSGRISVGIAAVSIAVVAAYLVARIYALHATPLTNIDMLGFHLPNVARWIQTGSVWRVDQFLPGFATAQYPNNGDFIILGTILPWHDLAFARFPGILFLPLVGVSVYALSLELGASRASGATFACAALAVPPLSFDAIEGLPDDVSLALFVIGLTFLVRYVRTRRRGELLISGLAFGLALGTKWFGLTAGVVVVTIWAITELVTRREVRRLSSDVGLMLMMMGVGGGFWLLRNLVESGNPLYPKAVTILGVHLFPGSRGDVIDRFGYTIADYLGHPHVLGKYVYPSFRSQLGIAAVVLLVGIVIAGVASARKLRHPPRSGMATVLFALAAVTVGICAIYMITPGSAYGPRNQPVDTAVNIRWLMPAVLLAAALCASSVQSIGRWGVALELAGLAAVIDGIKLSPSVGMGTVAKSILLLGVVVVVARIVIGNGVAAARRGVTFRWAAVAAGVLIAFLTVARLDQRGFDRQSYASYDPVFAWIEKHATAGHHIGYTGATGETPGLAPALPAFGPRLGNVVTYIGDRAEHSVELPRSERSFRTELLTAKDDLLMIGLPYAGPTDMWARQLGLPLLARSGRISLYAVRRQALLG